MCIRDSNKYENLNVSNAFSDLSGTQLLVQTNGQDISGDISGIYLNQTMSNYLDISNAVNGKYGYFEVDSSSNLIFTINHVSYNSILFKNPSYDVSQNINIVVNGISQAYYKASFVVIFDP